MSPRYNIEDEAKKLIFKAGEEGILQSEIWKELGATSREGSRIALKFEEKGIIERDKELHDGRWTYRLTHKKDPVTINSIEDCPCLVCKSINRCFVGGTDNPHNCLYLTAWIDPRIDKVPPFPEEKEED